MGVGVGGLPKILTNNNPFVVLLIFGLKGLTISVSTWVPIRESQWDKGLWNLREATFICRTNVPVITDAWAVLTVAHFTHARQT